MISISIKSEIDSRVVLYPLMRCLAPLGNCLLVTSNRQVSRLIEGDYEGDFRNFHILVDFDGGTDELLEDASINPEEYSYVVYDNVGIVEQDKLLIPIGPIISETFEAEMMYLGEDKNTHIIRFGKPVKNKYSKPKMTSEQRKEEALRLKKLSAEEKKAERIARKDSKDNKRKKSKNRGNISEEEIEETARAKFQPKKEDVYVKIKKLPNLQFPRFEDLELLESNKQFFNIDKNFIKFFYTVFEEYIGIKEPNFVREVTRKDAGSSDFSQRAASGENNIKFASS